MREFNCPSCGAALSIKDDSRDFAFCEYCGAKVRLDDYRTSHYVYDEARVKEAEYKMKELEYESKSRDTVFEKVIKWLWLGVTMILTVIIIVLFLTKGEKGYTQAFLLLFYVAGPIIGGGAFLVFKFIPERKKRKVLESKCAIKFPLINTGDNAFATEQILLGVGFENVQLIKIPSPSIFSFKASGHVESVKVDGITAKSNCLYMPDARIVIMHY